MKQAHLTGEGNFLDRYFSKIDMDGFDDCWVWTGNTNVYGYGELRGPYGQHTKAHRIALEIRLGRPLGRKHSLHRCDNPPCCNPNHLFEGAQKENMRDMWAKRRGSTSPKCIGEKNPAALLNASQVRVIKRCRRMDISLAALKRIFRVSLSTIACIAQDRTWKHVKI